MPFSVCPHSTVQVSMSCQCVVMLRERIMSIEWIMSSEWIMSCHVIVSCCIIACRPNCFFFCLFFSQDMATNHWFPMLLNRKTTTRTTTTTTTMILGGNQKRNAPVLKRSSHRKRLEPRIQERNRLVRVFPFFLFECLKLCLVLFCHTVYIDVNTSSFVLYV